MKCPNCGASNQFNITQSWYSPAGKVRQRFCKVCNNVFPTYEEPINDNDPLSDILQQPTLFPPDDSVDDHDNVSVCLYNMKSLQQTTSGAKFTLLYDNKAHRWQVRLVDVSVTFEGKSPQDAVNKAIAWIKSRRITAGEDQYKLT